MCSADDLARVQKSFLDVPPQAQQPSVEFFKTQDDATKP
jgi:hypothetical protein